MDSSILEFGLVKIKNRMANSVDPDEMAHYEWSHLNQHCLHVGIGFGLLG